MNSVITDQILLFIKMQGTATASELASELQITKEGARLHLSKLCAHNFITSSKTSTGVGRPSLHYRLSDKGLDRFPDAHAQITIDLLQSVKTILGENALDLLITDRETKSYIRYKQHLKKAENLEQKLDALCQIRTTEGYMAAWTKQENTYFLTENHCPICVAARACQGFCRAELKNFQQLIGEQFHVERIKHIVKEDQRCVYRIEEKPIN